MLAARTFAVEEGPWNAIPPASDPGVAQFLGLNVAWGYELTLTTFILTFFVGQAYAHWRNCYNNARDIQGRVNDMNLVLSLKAARERGGGGGSCGGGGYTAEASSLLGRCTRYTRLAHVLFWANMAPRTQEAAGEGGWPPATAARGSTSPS